MTNFLLFATTILIWGSSWYAIEFQLGPVAVEVSIAYRFLLGAALLFAWCWIRGKKLRYDWTAHKYFLLLGVLLFGLNYIAAYNAQYHITSALNAIGFSSMVWLNIINARIILKTHIEGRTYLGALMGATGIFVLFWPQISGASFSNAILIGAAFSLSGALIASFGNIVSQRAQQNRYETQSTLARQGLRVSYRFCWDPSSAYTA